MEMSRPPQRGLGTTTSQPRAGAAGVGAGMCRTPAPESVLLQDCAVCRVCGCTHPAVGTSECCSFPASVHRCLAVGLTLEMTAPRRQNWQFWRITWTEFIHTHPPMLRQPREITALDSAAPLGKGCHRGAQGKGCPRQYCKWMFVKCQGQRKLSHLKSGSYSSRAGKAAIAATLGHSDTLLLARMTQGSGLQVRPPNNTSNDNPSSACTCT